jgi:hypothetical protein
MAALCCNYVPMLSDSLCLPRLRFGLRHQELRDHFAELERTPLFETEPEDEEELEDEPLDNPTQEVEQRQRLAWVKAMLLQLGS